MSKFLFLIPLFLFSFCNCEKEQLEKSSLVTLQDFTGLDGCGYVFVLTDGTKLEPENLDQFDVPLVEGDKYKVRYKESNTGGSICMVGDVIEIISIVKE